MGLREIPPWYCHYQDESNLKDNSRVCNRCDEIISDSSHSCFISSYQSLYCKSGEVKYSPTLQPKSFKPLEYIPTRRAMPFTWGGTFSDTMRIFGLVVLLCSSNAVAAANTDEDDGNCATECGLSTLLLVIFPLRY